jgi:hypothetical protein
MACGPIHKYPTGLASRVGTEVEGAETGLGQGRVEPAVLTRREVGRVVLDPVHTRQRLLGRDRSPVTDPLRTPSSPTSLEA